MPQLLPPDSPSNGLGAGPAKAPAAPPTGPDPGAPAPAPGGGAGAPAPGGSVPPDKSDPSDDSAEILAKAKANPDKFEQLDSIYGVVKKKLGQAKELDKLFAPLAAQGDQAKPEDFIAAFGKVVSKQIMSPKKAADTLADMPQEPGQALAAWAKAWETKVKASGGLAMMGHSELAHNTLAEGLKRLGMIAKAQDFHQHVMQGKTKAMGQGPRPRSAGPAGPAPTANGLGGMGPAAAPPAPSSGAPPNG